MQARILRSVKHRRISRKQLFIGLAVLVVLLGIGGYALARTLTRDSDAQHSAHPQERQDEQTAETEQPETSAPEETPTPQQPAGFAKNQHSLTTPTSIWVIANKRNPLQPKEYAPGDLVGVGGGQQMRREAADALAQLRAGASRAGMTINPLSGYRSYNTQVATYQRWVNELGQAQADRESARPGHSEHQTGLAIDVGSGVCNIEQCFGGTADGKWLAAHAHEYGFVIRYPEHKESITGYVYEPWHIRYVGTALATELRSRGVQTLEEFFGLPAAPSY